MQTGRELGRREGQVFCPFQAQPLGMIETIENLVSARNSLLTGPELNSQNFKKASYCV